MIRRQARFLGKPVHRLDTETQVQFPEIALKAGNFFSSSCMNIWTMPAQPTPSALSLRCRAERSMPTNSAVREMLPEKRLIWAIR